VALSAAVLECITRYGRFDASQHPDVEAWYTRALLNEDSAAWGVLYEEAMAAKAAHFCLKYTYSADGNARGLITSEPVNGAGGSRQYKYDHTRDDWWRSTAPGAAFVDMAAEMSGGDDYTFSPLVCF
jgi:hypothetical protein